MSNSTLVQNAGGLERSKQADNTPHTLKTTPPRLIKKLQIRNTDSSRVPANTSQQLNEKRAELALIVLVSLPDSEEAGEDASKLKQSREASPLERGHGSALSARLQVSSTRDRMEESGELCRATAEQASGNMSGKIEGREGQG
ncbi:hypothetical protein EYF80_001171 [Liparis tanakae]|uniref:Uncharacterized protein n=1 Tax=Liparis tanakae TaxID=230148 RepID=A0A4Z2JDT7_9TELE|nr:hypothetical protein EYF80_001171 [Liparis tanakae]